MAKQIAVTTGLTGNGVTEVTSGLEPGMQLVTVGQAYLTDGAAVRIVTGQDAALEEAPAGAPEDAGEAAPQDGGGEAA